MSPKNKQKFVLFLLVAFIFIFRVQAQGFTVDGSLLREHTVTPGEGLEGTLMISNTEDSPVLVGIYLEDYFYNVETGSRYFEPGTIERTNAVWLQLESEQVTVPARSKASVRYSIVVPDDAELIGTYWSMIMVESAGAPPIPTDVAEGFRIGIAHNIRYGIQLVTHIGETGEGSLQIIDRRLVREDDKSFLELDILNSGDRWLRVEPRLELYNAEGRKVQEIEEGLARLYPGTSTKRQIELTDVEPGTYQALVIFDGGEDRVWGAQYTLNLE